MLQILGNKKKKPKKGKKQLYQFVYRGTYIAKNLIAQGIKCSLMILNNNFYIILF